MTTTKAKTTPRPALESDLLTVAEIARLDGVSAKTVRRAITSGQPFSLWTIQGQRPPPPGSAPAGGSCG